MSKATLVNPQTISMVPSDSDSANPELVLAVQRLALTKLGVGTDYRQKSSCAR
jgi:hypothetical protein